MNILILVLSYNVEPYSSLMKAQQATFDSIEVEGVRTVYYHGGYQFDETNWHKVKLPRYFFRATKNNEWSETIKFKCTDSYYYMAAKFQAALEYVMDWDYDIIFRTNSSSYVHKQRLINFAETLPTEKLYAGWTFVDSEDFGGICVSGAGIFLSRDTAEILRNEIDPNKELEEDVYCGRILRKHGIEAIDDKSRFDVGEEVDAYPPTDRYHYRLKNSDRYLDSQNFYRLHEKIK